MRLHYALAAAAVAILPVAAASAATSPLSWIQQNATANTLYSSSPPLAQYYLDKPGSYVYSNSITSKGVSAGLSAATVPLRYTSYAQFSADITSGALPSAQYPAGSVVIYDPEGGTGWPTPAGEQASPETYMPLFNSLAAAHGFRAIETPARDLGSTDTTCTASWTDLDSYYLNCQLAKYAVQNGALGLTVQDQGDMTNTTAYKTLFNEAEDQADLSNPAALVWTEVSDQRGTAAQANSAFTALKTGGAENADGAFLQVETSDISWEVSLLTTLQGEGY